MRQVRAHLSECPTCAAMFREQRAIKELIGAMNVPTPPPDFEARLVAHVFGATPETVYEMKRPGSGLRLFLGTAAVAAAAAWMWLQWMPGPATTSTAQGGATEVGYTVERDQAFLAGGDPAMGQTPVWTVGDGPR